MQGEEYIFEDKNGSDTEAICHGYRLAFPENTEEQNKLLQAKDEYWNW